MASTTWCSSSGCNEPGTRRCISSSQHRTQYSLQHRTALGPADGVSEMEEKVEDPLPERCCATKPVHFLFQKERSTPIHFPVILNTQQDALSHLRSACGARQRKAGSRANRKEKKKRKRNRLSETNPSARRTAYYVRVQQLWVALGSRVRLGSTLRAAQQPFICWMWILPTSSQSFTCFLHIQPCEYL